MEPMSKGERIYFDSENKMMDWLVLSVQGKEDAWKMFYEVGFDREENQFFAEQK